jgi:predicted HAD superfamily Cof-like phosphohydrolase
MVKEFHKKVIGRKDKLVPHAPEQKDRLLWENLLAEEYQEYMDATNVVEVADAIGDMVYILCGMAIVWGIDLDAVFTEIHRSNMTKKGTNTREDGKILKDEDFSPVDIAGVLGLDEPIFF